MHQENRAVPGDMNTMMKMMMMMTTTVMMIMKKLQQKNGLVTGGLHIYAPLSSYGVDYSQVDKDIRRCGGS